MSELTLTTPGRLAADEWTARAEQHRRRAERFLAPHAGRAATGDRHPVWDFLFTYYSLRPRQVRRWHPGYGVALDGSEAVVRYSGSTGYTRDALGVTISHDYLVSRLDTVRFIARLLEATAARPAQLNCFGMHEWAMVFRSDEVRHGGVPLRLGAAGTDRVVESIPLRCSHFDAFRFFTPEAAPHNAVALTRDTQVDREQPGCVHANMDLYMTVEGLNTAVYLRQSLDRDNDELAVARQRKACLKLCDERGWTHIEYVDNDTSASTRKPRPSYTRMLADITAGKINAIVCWHPDRLHRQPRDLEDLIDLGVPIYTVSGDLDLTTDMGRLVARLLGSVSRGEGERKSSRQKSAAAQRAQAGRAWWPSRPFGYADTKGTALHPEESDLVRDAYRFVQLGGTLHAIAQDWNDAGIKTPKGNVWRGAQVRQLLINPRNAARRFYDGADVGPADWPAIVDVDTWRSVVAILENPDRRSGPTRGRKFVLSGIAVCGACGEPLKSGIASATKAKHPVYVCKGCFRRAAAKTRWMSG